MSRNDAYLKLFGKLGYAVWKTKGIVTLRDIMYAKMLNEEQVTALAMRGFPDPKVGYDNIFLIHMFIMLYLLVQIKKRTTFGIVYIYYMCMYVVSDNIAFNDIAMADP
ncbi:hypothetical protein RFI_16382 [Reticulomyxa filosa]|uniref:Uncharacterized protein n=1 Tax=Reticulomyxa filosa TaxID=46433 RepID=X6N4J4_RETFI|nr:hypothetical protein RFI_16382 [Reticulomyxa filosa]|eukprot:ETO20833.1 hypothetical protein RFI_16382 [Reticulomyxa filosa]